jgi:tape measure domain-containing protein
MSKIAEAFIELQVKGAGMVQSALGNVSNVMRRLGEAAAEMARKFGRAMKGLADSVGAGFINRWNQFLSLMQSAQAFTGGLITSFASAGMKAGAALAQGIATKIGSAAGTIRQKMGTLLGDAKTLTGGLIASFASVGVRAGAALAQGVAARIGAASAVLRDKVSGVLSGMTLGNLDGAVAKLLRGFVGLPGAVASAASRAGASLRSFGQTVSIVVQGTRQLAAGMWDQFLMNTAARWNAATATVGAAMNAVTSRVRSAATATQSALTMPFKAFASWMQTNLPQTWAHLNTGWQAIRTGATSAASKMKQAIGVAASWVGSHVPQAFQKAMQKAGAAMQAIGPIAGALGSAITGTLSASLRGVALAAETAGAAIQAMYLNFLPAIGPIFNTIRAGITSVIGLAGRLGGALLSPLSMLKNFVFSFKGLLAGLGVSLGAAGISKYIVDVTADAERANVAFATMLGGAEKGAAAAKTLLGQLQKLGDTTPLELPELRDAAKTLLAMNTPAREVTKTLSMIGDVSTGLSVPLNHIAQIWGKISLANKIQGDDLRQFADNGIPVVDELAKKYGVTTAAIYAMSEAGTLSFKDLKETFTNLTSQGGRFHNMMAQIGTTMSGRWSTLKDTMRSIAVSIGESLAPALKKALDWGIKLAETLKARLEPLKRLFAGFADGFAAKLPAVAKRLEAAFPVIEQGVRAVFAVMKAVSEIASEIGTKVMSWVGGTSAVGDGITRLIQKVRFFAENWQAMWEIATAYMKDFWANTDVTSRAVLGQLGANILAVLNNLKAPIESLIEGILSFALAGLYKIKAEMMGFPDMYADVIDMHQKNAADSMKLAARQAARAFKNLPGFNLSETKISPALQAAIDKFKILGKLFDFRERMAPWLEAAQRFVDNARKKKDVELAGAAIGPAGTGKAPGDVGKFASHGLTDFAKAIQGGVKANEGVHIAKQSLAEQRKQTRLMERRARMNPFEPAAQYTS